MSADSRTSRRGLLIGLAALAGIAWGWQRFGVRRGGVEMTAIDGLPGWRRLETNAVTAPSGSAANAVFLGIGEGDAVPQLRPEDLCGVLYGETTAPVIAVFTDFFCPNCRALEAGLAARVARTPDLRLVWHQLPLLGPRSERVARAALSAEIQGGYDAYRDRLIAAPFRPTARYLIETAASVGLDPAKMLLDMDGPEVTRRLRTSRRAADTLGIFGTPSLTVGRTLVIGAIDDEQLDQLLESSGPAIC